MTSNHSGLISGVSTASPVHSALVKTNAIMSHRGQTGNRNVTCAASRSEAAATWIPDSSFTSRAAASAGDSPSST